MATIVDDDLLARAAAGDGDAFASFYRRHLPTIAAYLLRRTGDAETAADLTAEVFAAALLACPRYRPGGPPALAWLYGIAANKLRESRRRGRVEEEARRRLAWEPQALDDDDLAAIERMAAADDEPQVLAAVAALPPDQREAILDGRPARAYGSRRAPATAAPSPMDAPAAADRGGGGCRRIRGTRRRRRDRCVAPGRGAVAAHENDHGRRHASFVLVHERAAPAA